MAKKATKKTKITGVKKKTTKKKTSTSKARVTSPVKGKSVQWYIGTLEKPQSQIVEELDKLLTKAVPDATSSIKWAQPVYELGGPFCFIRSAKKHVTLGFWRGVELDDPNEILEGSGTKMKHVKLGLSDKIDKPALTKLIRQAVQLNKRQGDPTKG